MKNHLHKSFWEGFKMKLKDTGLTAQDIKDKVNKYMIETF